MLAHIPVLWQALLFSGTALFLVLVSAWWFYGSPLRGQPEVAMAPPPRLAWTVALLMGLSSLQLVVGGLWDASQHISTGVVVGGSDFLWPPHIMIYSAFLLAFLVAAVAIMSVARTAGRTGARDPRRWIRRYPYLGAVILASVYELASLPGDALWHELFGLDLTAWSPPHLLIAIANTVVVVCAVGLLLQARPAMRRPEVANWAVVCLLGISLSVVYMVGVLEWELPSRSFAVSQRPAWLYPLVGGGLAFFVLVLTRELVPMRWAATVAALVFYATRLAVMAGLGLAGMPKPGLPLLFILGAVGMDLLPRRYLGNRVLRTVSSAGAFVLGYALLAFPLLTRRADLAFNGLDMAVTLLILLTVSAVLWPLGHVAGAWLRGVPAEPVAASRWPMLPYG